MRLVGQSLSDLFGGIDGIHYMPSCPYFSVVRRARCSQPGRRRKALELRVPRWKARDGLTT